jgi:ribosome-associated protein
MTKPDQNTDTEALARKLAISAIEKLARDVRLIDLRTVVSYTDWFVVCTGQNSRQTRAIADGVQSAMQDAGYKRPKRKERDADGSWMLLDYNDVVFHVFTPEAREFYRLESLWGQVPQEVVEDPAATARAEAEAAAASTEFGSHPLG